MPPLTEISMDAYQLPPVLQCGFLEIRSADALPASKVIHSGLSDDKLSLTFWGDAERDSAVLVSIQMYRLPEGRAEFDRNVIFFSDTRKKWARLPEGVKTTAATLAPVGVPASWKHDGFPRSGHDMIHTFTSDRHALLIRYLGGKMLDNPLFRLVNENLRVVEDQWELAPPQCTRREGGEPGAIERPLTDDVIKEISDAVQRGYLHLGLTPEQGDARVVPQAILKAVDRVLSAKKRVPSEQVESLAIDLGCLWAQCLCDSVGWRWCELTYDGEQPTFAVVSPDGAHAVAPTPFLLRQLSQRGRRAENTILLLFNTIAAGSLPAARPNGYTRLG